MSGRDASGRFAAGFSPDRGRGRPRAQPVRDDDRYRQSILSAANLPVTIRAANGRRRTISLFELCVRQLAIGQTSRRRSPTPFIRLVIACAGEAGAAPDIGRPRVDLQPIDPVLSRAKLQLDTALVAGSDATKEAALGEVLTRIRGLARCPRD